MIQSRQAIYPGGDGRPDGRVQPGVGGGMTLEQLRHAEQHERADQYQRQTLEPESSIHNLLLVVVVATVLTFSFPAEKFLQSGSRIPARCEKRPSGWDRICLFQWHLRFAATHPAARRVPA